MHFSIKSPFSIRGVARELFFVIVLFKQNKSDKRFLQRRALFIVISAVAEINYPLHMFVLLL